MALSRGRSGRQHPDTDEKLPFSALTVRPLDYFLHVHRTMVLPSTFQVATLDLDGLQYGRTETNVTARLVGAAADG